MCSYLCGVLKEAYLSVQEAVEDGHHKPLEGHRGQTSAVKIVVV